MAPLRLSSQSPPPHKLWLKPAYWHTHLLIARGFADKPMKPLAYDAKPISKPLVQARSATRTQNAATAKSSSSEHHRRQPTPPAAAKPERTGVAFPRIRIAIGVVLCGAIIYSMVYLPIPSSAAPRSPSCMPVRRPLTTRGPLNRGARHPHKTRKRRDSFFAHALTHGIVYKSPAKGDS